MQFVLVTIVLESSLAELESSTIQFLRVKTELESSLIQLQSSAIKHISNVFFFTSKNVIIELYNLICTCNN